MIEQLDTQQEPLSRNGNAPVRFCRTPPDARPFPYADPSLNASLVAEQPPDRLADDVVVAAGEKLPAHWKLLCYHFHTVTLAADREHAAADQDAQRRLEAQQQRAREEREALTVLLPPAEEKLAEAEAALAEVDDALGSHLSVAGLVCPPERAGVDGVEAALQAAASSPEAAAGAAGVLPAERSPSLPAQALELVFTLLAPAAAGFVLALCMGALLGLITLADLEKGDRLLPVFAAGLLGTVTVYLLGAAVSRGTRLLSQAVHPEPNTPHECPPLRGTTTAAVLVLLAAAVVAGAEITADACGMRELHLQRLTAMARVTGQAAEPLPFRTYCLVALLVTVPFLAWKAATTWKTAAAELLEAQLAHGRAEWIRQKRASDSVQNAFSAAYELDRLRAQETTRRAEVERLRARLEATRIPDDYDPVTAQRVDYHRKVAAALRTEFDRALESLVDEVEPRRRRWLRRG